MRTEKHLGQERTQRTQTRKRERKPVFTRLQVNTNSFLNTLDSKQPRSIPKRQRPRARNIRLEHAPYGGGLCDYILKAATNPCSENSRLELAVKFSKGVAHTHSCSIIWGDLSTRNALLFNDLRLKLCEFAESDLIGNYPRDCCGCEDRYCPPGSNRPQFYNGSTTYREIFAFGTANYGIAEWKVPYDPQTEVPENQVFTALVNGIWPHISNNDPAKDFIRRC